MTPIRAATRRRAPSAFSLVEVVVALVIIGTMFAASAMAIGSATRDRRVQAELQRGSDLCRLLLAEIMEQRYADPNGVAGPNPGTARSAWDNVDDYNGLVESPLTNKSGTPIDDAAGWKRSATVSLVSVDLSGLTIAANASDAGLKRITVTATSPRGVTTTLIGYRSSAGAPDSPTPAGGLATWVGVSLKVGREQRSVSAGTDLLNFPPP